MLAEAWWDRWGTLVLGLVAFTAYLAVACWRMPKEPRKPRTGPGGGGEAPDGPPPGRSPRRRPRPLRGDGRAAAADGGPRPRGLVGLVPPARRARVRGRPAPAPIAGRRKGPRALALARRRDRQGDPRAGPAPGQAAAGGPRAARAPAIRRGGKLMHVITMLNQKGGGGQDLALPPPGRGRLAGMERRAPAPDYDPQASLTQGLLGSDAAEAIGRGTVRLRDRHRAVRRPRLEAVPHDRGRGGGPGARGTRHWPSTTAPTPVGRAPTSSSTSRISSTWCGPITTWSLIDCPPNLQLMSWQALMASTDLVVPVMAEDYGVQGLRPVMDFLEAACAEKEADELRLAGIAINKFDRRRKLHQFYEARLPRRVRRAGLRRPGARVFGVQRIHPAPPARDASRPGAARRPRRSARWPASCWPGSAAYRSRTRKGAIRGEA